LRKLLIAFFIIVSTSLFADEIGTTFQKGNEAYRSGNYQKAIELYQSILSQGYQSTELYYNLGNSYYKLNKIPDAVLEYERAHRLAPRDEDINHNLALANLRITDKIDPIPELFFVEWWGSFSNLFTADQWAWIAIVSLWTVVIAVTFLLLKLQQASVRFIFVGVVFASILIAVLSFAGMIAQSRIANDHYSAIVFAPSVTAKSAPDKNGTDLFVVHEGVKIELLDHVSDWNKIRLADGKIGWVPSGSFQVI